MGQQTEGGIIQTALISCLLNRHKSNLLSSFTVILDLCKLTGGLADFYFLMTPDCDNRVFTTTPGPLLVL